MSLLLLSRGIKRKLYLELATKKSSKEQKHLKWGREAENSEEEAHLLAEEEAHLQAEEVREGLLEEEVVKEDHSEETVGHLGEEVEGLLEVEVSEDVVAQEVAFDFNL